MLVSSAVNQGFYTRSDQTPYYKTSMFCSTKHAALRGKNKDRFARSQFRSEATCLPL